jgi:hypothetical protein
MLTADRPLRCLDKDDTLAWMRVRFVATLTDAQVAAYSLQDDVDSVASLVNSDLFKRVFRRDGALFAFAFDTIGDIVVQATESFFHYQSRVAGVPPPDLSGAD